MKSGTKPRLVTGSSRPAVELFLRVERLDGVSECRELIKEIVSGREAEDDDLAAARAGRTTVVDGSNTVAEIAEPGVGVGVTNDRLEDKDTVQPVPQLDRRRPIWSIVLALFCIAVALLLRTLLGRGRQVLSKFVLLAIVILEMYPEGTWSRAGHSKGVAWASRVARSQLPCQNPSRL